MVGKPHAAIYATALRRFADLAARPVEPGRILAIGDGAETDLRGAVNQGIDVLFVTGGIHAGHFGEGDEPDRLAGARFPRPRRSCGAGLHPAARLVTGLTAPARAVSFAAS